MQQSRIATFLAAFAASFAVYLIPLFHFEAGWLPFGEVLLVTSDFTTAFFLWLIIALILQLVTFLLFLWVLTRFSVARLILLIALVPVCILGTNILLLWVVPLYFLVERDAAPEVGSLEMVCTVQDVAIAQVRAGADLSLVQSEEVWLLMADGRSRAVLRMPDCQLSRLKGTFDGSTIDSVAPGGRVLHRQKSGAIGYLDLSSNGFEMQSQPENVRYWKPILTDDGLGLVWLDSSASEGDRRSSRVHIRDLVSGEERVASIGLPGTDQLEFLGARSIDGPFTLARFRNAIFRIDIEGAVLSGPLSPEGIYDARWGFVWLEDGWIAWDGYREEGRHRIVWQTPKGHGALSIPRGRSIDALSASANGELIAVAISSTLRIGSIESAVFIIRADTGEEIYRKRYPDYTRPSVAFLGDEHLAVGGTDSESATVVVYRAKITD